MEVVEEEELVREEILDAFLVHNEKDNIDVKKDILLRRNFGLHDFSALTPPPFETATEFSNSDGSPPAFAHRNTNRKYATVTSDSEDENSPSPSAAGQSFHGDVEKQGDIYNVSAATEKNESIGYSCFDSEVSFVPETQLDEGKESVSETMSCSYGAGNLDADPSRKESVKCNSNVEAKNDDISMTGLLHENLKVLGFWGSSNSVGAEGVDDSQLHNVDAVARGCEMLDECSRIDFHSRSKSIKNLRSWVATDLVQETWRKLRGNETDFKQHVTPMEKENSRAMKLTSSFCSLLSETDLLLSGCQHLLCDVLEAAAVPPDESESFCCYDEQLHIASATAEHGFCLYAKNMASLQTNLNTKVEVDLIQEMLGSSSSIISVGKLIGNNMATDRVIISSAAESSSSEDEIPLRCEKASLEKVIRSVVSPKSHIASKGDAMHEYLSFLGQISRLESGRLSKGITETTSRRRWVARHYLTDGALNLSPADILLLDRYNSNFKTSHHSPIPSV